jgi:hypothetical protein
LKSFIIFLDPAERETPRADLADNGLRYYFLLRGPGQWRCGNEAVGESFFEDGCSKDSILDKVRICPR